MQVILSSRGGGAASVLSFLLVVLIFVIVLVPSVSSRNYHNATEVMVNVNGTDRDLQYVFDNNFFNSDLRDRQGLVFADPSSIHHGKHQASEILVSSDGKTGTLLNYLRNKTLPSGFSRNYSIPTHPATMVFFSSGKSLQELVDAGGKFTCTYRYSCSGSYQVVRHSDCSTSRHYCSHGCSGGSCRPDPNPSPPPTPSGPIVNWNSSNNSDDDDDEGVKKQFVRRTITGSGKWSNSCSTSWKSKRLSCPDGLSAVRCTSRLSGGPNHDYPLDGDEHKCSVRSTYCTIQCRENACSWCGVDKCECGVTGSCICEGYV